MNNSDEDKLRIITQTTSSLAKHNIPLDVINIIITNAFAVNKKIPNPKSNQSRHQYAVIGKCESQTLFSTEHYVIFYGQFEHLDMAVNFARKVKVTDGIMVCIIETNALIKL